VVARQIVKEALQDGNAEGLVADVDPDVRPAVEAAKRDFLGDGVVKEGSLGRENSFFETFPCQAGFAGHEA
jgi:hypothetical protein